MNPLKSVPGTIISGFVLAVLITYSLMGETAALNMKSIIVWLHVFVGIIWIGLLYYFNFVQVPAVGEAIKDGNPGPQAINQYVAPRALAWFRYGALLTWLTGVFAIEIVYGGGSTMKVFMLQGPFAVIGVGAWLGTIMFLNVWGLIWTNQKKILNLGKYKDNPVSDDEKAQAKTIALMASRANTLLSIPMIMCMIGGGIGHGLPF